MCDLNINFVDYDIEDCYDYNGNGNFCELDGVIDYLMIFYVFVGEEVGGGVLGVDVIWLYCFNFGCYYVFEGMKSNVFGCFNG